MQMHTFAHAHDEVLGMSSVAKTQALQAASLQPPSPAVTELEVEHLL
jgi:hypothetical protein